jgi:organic hydroperoxide reductase OsmC/OhrA
MQKIHHYNTTIKWTGNKGSGTDDYRNYERSHHIIIENKSVILGSSDTVFRGDGTKHNPEDLLLASISSCHMLWYLHLCADAGVIVVDYIDNANGQMSEGGGAGGRFTEVTIHPLVTVKDKSMIEKAMELHHKAHEFCFIANSVNFSIYQKPTIVIAEI